MQHGLVVSFVLLVFVPRAAAADLVAYEEAAWRAAAARVADSVVQIRLIGGLEQIEGKLLGSGATTGLVVSKDGYVVSSAYPFAQRPSSILVIVPGGERLPARLVATDHSRMIVLLKIEPPAPLTAVQNTGFSDEPGGVLDTRVGGWAIAVGRTMQVDVPNTSVGIISVLGRMQGRAIQTDAKISSANYGGPLVDLWGRVLGVLVPMKPGSESEVAGAEFYDSGIGFAVPIEQVHAAVEKLKTGEDLHRGRLGISFSPSAPYRTLPRVDAVLPDSPAKDAGLQKDDLILAIDDKPVETVTQLRAALGPRYAGETIELKVRREEKEITISAKLVADLPRVTQDKP